MYTALVNAMNVDACVVTRAHAKRNCNTCPVRHHMACVIPGKSSNRRRRRERLSFGHTRNSGISGQV